MNLRTGHSVSILDLFIIFVVMQTAFKNYHSMQDIDFNVEICALHDSQVVLSLLWIVREKIAENI